jgi:hypothetical protein
MLSRSTIHCQPKYTAVKFTTAKPNPTALTCTLVLIQNIRLNLITDTGSSISKHTAAWGSSEYGPLGKDGTVCSLSDFPPEN